jgi:tetratricopeptide (TPR) repeat protein
VSHRTRRLAVISAAAAAVLGACSQKEVRPEELFQAQSQGLGYLETGQLPEAEAQFKKVIELAPKEPLGYANLGLTYLRGSRYSDAEKQLRHARELDPKNADIALMAAKLYAVTGRASEARDLLEQIRRDAPRNAHALYALAELDAPGNPSDSAGTRRYENDLRDVIAVAPTNLAVRLKLIDALVRRGAADSALRQLEEVRRVGPELPPEAKAQLEQTIQLLRDNKTAEARAALDLFLHSMELTSQYQASLEDVKWLEGPLAGRPVLTFTPKSLVTLRGTRRDRPATEAVRFVDATTDVGLPAFQSTAGLSGAAAIASGDYDGDGTDDLFVSFSSPRMVTRLYHVRGGQFLDVTERSGISLPAGAVFATFADVDNDGRLDLFVIGGDQRGYLLHNSGGAKFEDVTARSGIGNVGGARKAFFADLDHDGDLDLLLIGGPSLVFYRNNLDGTFTEMTQAVGLTAGSGGATRDAGFADLDGDGRIDLFVAREHGLSLYHNNGNRTFSDVAASSGIAVGDASAAVIGDYNNDGFFDVFVAGSSGHESSLWLNTGNGTFKRDARSADALQRLRGTSPLDATFVDYDNDGWLDLLVAGAPAASGRDLILMHNDGSGKFADASEILPATPLSGTAAAAEDVNGDGDLDLLVANPAGVRLLRNDGGNANLSMQVQLVGLRTGSGKNNDFGIGAKVEVRAAELRQTRVVSSRITHFGLGPHLKADVVRIEWTNGVPQTVFFPGTDQDVIENEVLKGSCAFLYTWDGTRFRFMTDVMWRSALGMPLGLLGSSTAYAPPGASQEYLRIPSSALQPRNGTYTMQLTEELWETAYADQLKLLAVDHPDSVDVFVDERFVPPGPVRLRLFHVAHPQVPLSATDDRGNDLLPALRAQDDVYASNLIPLQYQGLVETHDLIMDLGPDAGRDSSFLFLRGWIYPTDASINVALSQSRAKTAMPSLEVRDARGQWTMAIPSIGFPSGKDKTLIVDLAGKFPTGDHHVRIRTNLQIYWDQAFVARDAQSPGVRVTPLNALAADLHFRGYSRTYRKGGRYGPWWFDYDSVSKEPLWRPIEGAFTRFGDVLPLLRESDDMYVIMAAGDEMTLQFDARSAAALPAGWKRDFLLYTDGWIKDSDLNTAFGTTVAPLPFHKIREYPYAAGESYPSDSAHQRYLREYNTRVVDRTISRAQSRQP